MTVPPVEKVIGTDGKPALRVPIIYDIEERITRKVTEVPVQTTPAKAEAAKGDTTMAGGHGDDHGKGGGSMSKVWGWIAVIVVGLLLINVVMNLVDRRPLISGIFPDRSGSNFRPTSGNTVVGPSVGRSTSHRNDGQWYCDNVGHGGTFMYWKGSGPSRMAHCQ